ncbi:MAG: tandem-95 repeat protein, partial [Puniceicoccaceae bacterium]
MVNTGNPFNLTWTVTNIGQGDVPARQGQWTDQIWLSRDTFLDTRSDHYVGFVRRDAPLAAGESYTVTGSFNLPRGLTGPYYVFVVTDPPMGGASRGQVIETNEANNRRHTVAPMLIELPPPSDLQVDVVTAPTSARVGDPITVTWTVTNHGDEPATGRWTDAVYLSSDLVWDFGDLLLGTLEPSAARTLQPGQSYTASLTVPLLPALPGPWRILVRTDLFNDVFEGPRDDNNVTASTDALNLTVRSLVPGTPLQASLPDRGSQLFRIDVPAGQTLQINLEAAGGSNELYVRRGAVPSSSQFDAAFEGPLQASQSAVVPTTEAGTYYILVRSQGGPAQLPITLTARYLPFGITSVSPDRGGQDRYVTTTIRGAGFAPNATVRLIRPQFGEVVPLNFQVVDATRIVAVFDLREAPLGLYDLEVRNPDGRVSIIPYRFLVEPAQPLNLTVGLGGTDEILLSKAGFPNAFYGVYFLDLGNLDNPYVFVEYGVPRIPNATFIPGERLLMQTNLAGEPAVSGVPWTALDPILNLDGLLTARGFAVDFRTGSLDARSFGLEIYPGLKELLAENPDFLRNLSDEELLQLEFDFFIYAAATPFTVEEYLDYQRARADELRQLILTDARAPQALVAPATDAAEFESLYLQALVGAGLLRSEDLPSPATTRAVFVSELALLTAGLLGQADGAVPTGEHASFFEMIREWAGHQPDAFGSSAIPDREAFDLGLTHQTRFEAFRIRVVVPDDFFTVFAELRGEQAESRPGVSPADLLGGPAGTDPGIRLTGPNGFGPENFVPGGRQSLPFIISLANPADGRPVRELRLVQEIDPLLDPRSFQLASIRLGDLELALPANRAAFDGEFNLVDSHGFVLQVSAGIDVDSGVATWLLRAIDPLTGLLISEPGVGLLRPGEDARFAYQLRTRPETVTGDSLETRARVIIDNGPPVDTNHVALTFDTEAPVSAWTAQPGPNNTFTVSWEAEDQALGSGVREYSVYVSLDGQNYTPLLTRTDLTSATYTAPAGSQPLFLVLAADHAGNLEAQPAGLSIPLFPPALNLGFLPPTPPTSLDPLPPTAPPTLPAVHPFFLQALEGVPAALPGAAAPSFSRVIAPFNAATFTSGLPGSGAGINALGVAVAGDGSVYLTGGAGRNHLYHLPVGGGPAGAPLAVFDTPVYALAFDRDGALWATSGGGQLLLLDPATGAILERHGQGVTLGLAADPESSRLYVATSVGIQIFDTETRVWSDFSTTRVEGLAVAPDGALWGITWPQGRQLVRFDARGRPEPVAETGGQGVALAFGHPGTLLENLAFVSTTGGRLLLVEPGSRQVVEIARGGARGAFLAAGSDGRIYLAGGRGVDVLFPARPPSVLASDPADQSGLTTAPNRITITFNAPMFRGGVADPRSVSNPDNYILIDTLTGQRIPVALALYDPARREVVLSFDTLLPSNYELRVLPILEDDFGMALAAGYVAEFSVVEDRTEAVAPGLEFSKTRIDRAAGTISFDLRLTNPTEDDLTGPVRFLFDGLLGQGIGVVNANGRDGPEGAFYRELLPSGGRLAPGQSTPWITVTMDNPAALKPNLAETRVQTGFDVSLRPAILSAPDAAAAAGVQYRYQATATAPAGESLAYLLLSGPEGAQIDPQTGLLLWEVPRGGSDQVSFDLRVLSSSGAYTRQTWSVNVSGVNRPPVIAPVANQTLTEGETLVLTFTAVDPEGDALLFWMDNLPAGASFDPVTRTLRWETAGGDAGIYPDLRLTVSDGVNDTVRTFAVTVQPGNLPPVFEPLPDRTVAEGGTLAFRVNAVDGSGRPVTYTAVNLPSGASLASDTGLFLWSPGYDQAGVYDVVFEASNGLATATRTVQLTVLPVNGPVRFIPVDPLVLREGQNLSVRVIAVDTNTGDFGGGLAGDEVSGVLPPQHTLTYTVDGLPAGAVYDETTRLFTWRPGYDQAGHYTITFTAANDGAGTGTPNTDTLVLQIEVLDANGVPVVESIGNREVAVGESLLIPVSAVDPDGGPLELSVAGLPAFASFIDFGDGTGLIEANPQPGQRGVYTLTLRARDDGNGIAANALTGEHTFLLVVTSPNEPPIFAAVPDRVALIGQEMVFTVRVSDPDEDPLTYSATGLPAGATFTATGVYGVAEFRWTPAPEQAGAHTITLEVTDSGNFGATTPASDTATFTVVVRTENQRPLLQPIAPQTLAQDQPFALALSASDPDGDPLFFFGDNLPRGARLDPFTGDFTWTPDFAQSGTYTFILGASDGHLADSQVVTVTVALTNRAPFITAPAYLLAQEGLALSFEIGGGDLDGDPLVFSALNLPAGASFNPDTRRLQWTPGFDQAGIYELTFRVSDPAGATATTTTFIQVLNVNRPPVFPTPPSRQLLAGVESRFFLAASDPDAEDVLTFQLQNLPAGASFDEATGEFVWTPVGAQAGRYDLPVTVSDGRASVTRVLTLIVNRQPVPPSVQVLITPGFPVTPGATVFIEPTAAGASPIQSIEVSINGQLRALDSLGRVRFEPSAPGRYEVLVRATDADGFTAERLAEILVRDPADRDAPVVGLEAPAAGSTLSAVSVLTGSVQDTNLDRWSLRLIPVAGGGEVVLAGGIAPVAGELALLDPSRFENGAYLLRLEARDISGRTSVAEHRIEINTAVKTGTHTRVATDLVVNLGGIELAIQRGYDSLHAEQSGSFGLGWRFLGVDPRITTSLQPTGRESEGLYPAFNDGDRVYLTLSDGSRAGFTFAPVSLGLAGGDFFLPGWSSDPGVGYTLSSPSVVLRATAEGYLRVGNALPYNPASGQFGLNHYTVTAPDGAVFRYQTGFGLRETVSPDGIRLVWSGSGIVAPDGSRVAIERDSSGRITRLAAPDGSQAVYHYDAAGHLVQVSVLEADRRTWLGYRTDDDGRLWAVLGDTPEVIRYDEEGLFVGTDPIDLVAGGLRSAFGETFTLTAGANGPARLGLFLDAAELATSLTGQVTIGIEVTATAGASPDPAQILGFEAGYTSVEGNRSLALVTLDAAGPLVIEAGDGSGSVTVRIFLAGDADGDGRIDGTDEDLVRAAIGAVAGDPAYSEDLDWNRDGVIDENDLVYVETAFGFIANRAPVIEAANLVSLGGAPVTLDLRTLATDPDGDRLRFLALDPVNGTLRWLDHGRTVVFTPDPGFTGTAGFTIVADDGLLRSAPASIAVTVEDVTFTGFRIANPDPILAPGSIHTFKLIGLYEGGEVALGSSNFTVRSLNPTIAAASPDGSVLGLAAGTAAIAFDLPGGGSIAAAVTVGTAENRLLEFYPASYALRPGDTRQLVLRERVEEGILQLNTASAGTLYFTSDPGIATVDADGLVTALQPGRVVVSMVQGGQSHRVAFTITEAAANGTVIGTDGGVVANGDLVLGLPAGAFDTETAVSIRRAAPSERPFDVPAGFEYAGGIQVELGGRLTGVGLSLEMDAPAGAAVGEVFYIMQPGTLDYGTGEPTDQAWFLMDTLVVGEDGKLRSTSPPNLGLFNRRGENGIFFVPSIVGYSALMSPNLGGTLMAIDDFNTRLQANQSVVGRGQTAPVISMQGALGGSDEGPKYFSIPGPLGDTLLPLSATFNYTLNTRFAQPNGLVLVDETGVSVLPGQTATYSIPFPPRYIVQGMAAPSLIQAFFDFGPADGPLTPRVVLEGSDFLLTENPFPAAPDFLGSKIEDLFITLEVGGRDSFDFEGNVLPVGGRDFRIDGADLTEIGENTYSFDLPAGFMLAGTYITVSRQMYAPLDGEFRVQVVTSNPIQINSVGRYTFSVNNGDNSVSAIDNFNTVELQLGGEDFTKFDPVEAARIPLAQGAGLGFLNPRKAAFSPDGNRLYVGLSAYGGISVIDTVALHEIDTNPDLPGIRPIRLPTGARIFDVAVEPGGRYLYASDANTGAIYVIDIDPFSADFHRHVRTIAVSPAPLGLRELAVSPDGATLVATAPGRTLFGAYAAAQGHLIIIDTNAASRQAPVFKTAVPVGPEPYAITATDDPKVFLFTDRLANNQGVGVLRMRTSPDGSFFTEVETLSLNHLGIIPRLIEGRQSQVFGLSNASGITFLPANHFEDSIGPHPSFAFITSYNRFVPGDPKSDPSMAPIFAYNHLFTDENGVVIGVPLGAGGNVGVIRNPLGDFNNLIDRPRVVAATSPIMEGFPEGISLDPTTGLLYAGFHSEFVFTYDARLMVATIEEEAKGEPAPLWSQIGEPLPVPEELSRLIRGPLSTVPIDVINPLIATRGHYGFFRETADGPLQYGIAPTGPDGTSPNRFAPIEVGRLPRGLASPPPLRGDFLALSATPYNQAPTLSAFPNEPLTVSAGFRTAVDVHTGALRDSVDLVAYRSLNQSHQPSLHYHSIRAQPDHLYYFSIGGLPADQDDRVLVTRLTLRGEDGVVAVGSGLDPVEAARLGLTGGEVVFEVPTSLEQGAAIGAGLPIDLGEVPTGLYTIVLEYGLFRENAEGRLVEGRFFTFSQPYAVVNSRGGMFGAGWGWGGLLELFPGDAGVLLVNGNGQEEIYLAPREIGEAFTSLSAADHAELRQLADGTFVLRDKWANVYEFNRDGKLSILRDRNGNETHYQWAGDALVSITDPVGLVTRFEGGERITAIVDPAGRRTVLEYEGDSLTAIIDPYDARRTFEYSNSDYVNVMTGQIHPRGHTPSPGADADFRETWTLGEAGRIV